MAPARGATTMIRIGKPMHSCLHVSFHIKAVRPLRSGGSPERTEQAFLHHTEGALVDTRPLFIEVLVHPVSCLVGLVCLLEADDIPNHAAQVLVEPCSQSGVESGAQRGGLFNQRYFDTAVEDISQDLRPECALRGAACEDDLGEGTPGARFYDFHVAIGGTRRGSSLLSSG